MLCQCSLVVKEIIGYLGEHWFKSQAAATTLTDHTDHPVKLSVIKAWQATASSMGDISAFYWDQLKLYVTEQFFYPLPFCSGIAKDD